MGVGGAKRAPFVGVFCGLVPHLSGLCLWSVLPRASAQRMRRLKGQGAGAGSVGAHQTTPPPQLWFDSSMTKTTGKQAVSEQPSTHHPAGERRGGGGGVLSLNVTIINRYVLGTVLEAGPLQPARRAVSQPGLAESRLFPIGAIAGERGGARSPHPTTLDALFYGRLQRGELPRRAGFYGDSRKAATRSGSFSGLISVLSQRRTCVSPPSSSPPPPSQSD